MTTEGEQQEAVCGTCAGDPRDGDGYHAYNCPERTGRTPAPVVPSDDHEHLHRHVDARGFYIWHEHAHSHDAATQHDEDDYEDSQHSHGDDPSHGTYEVSARGHIREPTAGAAPPTPSQDAEGDGPVCSCGEPAASRCDDEIHARELRLGHECPFTHHPFDDVRRRAYASYDTWEGKGLSRDARESGFIYGYERGRADAESAIREPYEELVKALLTSSIAQSVLTNFKSRGVSGVCDVLERDWGSDESDVAEFCAALTNIEESQGGRS